MRGQRPLKGVIPNVLLPSDQTAFLSTLVPSRRNEILKHFQLYDSDVIPQIAKKDPQLAATLQELNSEVKDEAFLTVAGKGYRKLGDKLTRGKEAGKRALVPDTPIAYSEEEQDILELLSLMKEYDYQMSGDRISHDKSHAFLQDRIHNIVKNNIKNASIKHTGRGGVIGDAYRSNHPDLVQIGPDEELRATSKFMTSNLTGNEIGQQPTTMLYRDGNRSSVPVEHTYEPFKENPSRGLAVDNRDLGSTLPNSVTRAETDPETILSLLYNKIADKAEYIDQTYGVGYRTLMDEMNMDYKVGQRDWDPNRFYK